MPARTYFFPEISAKVSWTSADGAGVSRLTTTFAAAPITAAQVEISGTRPASLAVKVETDQKHRSQIDNDGCDDEKLSSSHDRSP